MPTVTIGLPVFNGERYLGEAIESVLGQTYSDFELLIADNCSTDGTADICQTYVRSDARVSYARWAKNQGAAANYNLVFSQARGSLFKWAAHDDRLRPQYLEKCVRSHRESAPVLATVYPRTEYIDEDGLISHPDHDAQEATSEGGATRAFQMLQSMNTAHAISGLHNAQLLRRTRLVGSFVSADYVLLLELAMLGRIVFLDTEPLFQRREHLGMSRAANKTTEEVLRWFDPNARSRLSEYNRLRLEYSKSPFMVVGLAPFERLICSIAIVSGYTTSFVRSRVTRAS